MKILKALSLFALSCAMIYGQPAAVTFYTGGPANGIGGNCGGSIVTQVAGYVDNNGQIILCHGGVWTVMVASSVLAASVTPGAFAAGAYTIPSSGSLAATGSGTITATAITAANVAAGAFAAGAYTVPTGGSLAASGSGTITATAVTASHVTAGAFAAGAYTVPQGGSLGVTGNGTITATAVAYTGVSGLGNNEVLYGNGTGVPSQASGFTFDGTILAVPTVQPSTSYKAVDGTAGATVTTCTGFKNGLCISGT